MVEDVKEVQLCSLPQLRSASQHFTVTGRRKPDGEGWSKAPA